MDGTATHLATRWFPCVGCSTMQLVKLAGAGELDPEPLCSQVLLDLVTGPAAGET
jgi:hypothetical protein